ncbi:OmpA family protein [Thermomonas hydrothermalis]|uniref:OmpA-OmpF porin, OOP family n=1 Tax=Thermomonas hydrothermalis TaxID=213588 RepID=A0A1M4UYF3_9GAMM|nr:OmpA-OmpF porin, OOP family [Thermomonas hydrothermalis]
MNKKLLCAALLGGLGLAQAAAAQEFDDRWYVSGSVGVNFQDKDRGTDDAIFGTLGFGKFLTPRVSLDTELNYQNPKKQINSNYHWSQYGVSLDARYHFRDAGDKFWPYLRGGFGVQRHEEEYNGTPGPNPARHKASNLALNLGIGMQLNSGRANVRTELGARIDFDDEQARIGHQQNQFVDYLASVGLTYALGPEPVAPVAPAPAPEPMKTCADMDDDGDGVNNCDDKCPGSQAGQTIGPDGCPVAVSIDLKGVNFDFDKDTLRPDAVAILNEAVEILKRYPELKVEVAGHTDQCGKEGYNQKLSERRAKVVYDFLTSNGIDASRLAGPNGYGFSRPLEDKGHKFPACKSELNRRTELNSQ